MSIDNGNMNVGGVTELTGYKLSRTNNVTDGYTYRQLG
jgi:hypothetical protein